VAVTILETNVGANARLLEPPYGVNVPKSDVGGSVGIVVVHVEVAVGQDREPRRVNLRLRAESVGVGGEIIGVVAFALAFLGEGLAEHEHEAGKLCLFGIGAPVCQGRSDRRSLHFLQTYDVGEGIERGDGARNPLHGVARARDAAGRMAEVPNVVGQHP
jgi:hypothetical protein